MPEGFTILINTLKPKFRLLLRLCQHSALTHNKSYRKKGSCVKISVTEGGKSDTTPLLNKTRHGAKVYKVYQTAQTPYQRLLEADVLTEARRRELAATYNGLNPVWLLKQINSNLEQL